MICDGKFVFRKGRLGDKPPDGCTPGEVPDFVLELHGRQVASAWTVKGENRIYMITSFERGKGYCTKFIELWERHAREKGLGELTVSHVSSLALKHILEKRGFTFELDNYKERTYRKVLQRTLRAQQLTQR